MFTLTDISIITWILIGCGLVFAVSYLLIGPLRYRRLITLVNRQSQEDNYTIATDDDGNPLRLSVIAYSSGHIEEVTDFLEAIKAQDYPDVEVIIVVDGAMREAANLSEALGEKYPFAGFTFVPPEARNLSRRKLANTIGIKKSTGSILLTTLTNIEIPSAQWLTAMASAFSHAETEIVLGAAFMDFRRMHGLKRWYRRYDSLLTAAAWMLRASEGSPYRGDGANLAFRRDLFFRNSGYGNNYYLHAGDDDIFVSQVSTGSNAEVMFARQATLRVDWGESTNRIWVNHKDRYTFARRYLTRAPRLLPTCISLTDWLATASLIATIILSVPANLLMPAISALLLFTFWGCQIALYRTLASTFGSTRLWWSVPLFNLIRPLADFLFKIRRHRSRNLNFTWRR